jgi:uncharacterized protein
MLPAAATVFVLRQWIIPKLPDHLFMLHSFSVTKDRLIMLTFAAIMFAAAWAMLRPSSSACDEAALRNPLRLGLQGLAVGLVTGLVGAGGGFLIVPALVLLAGLPMRRAVGTSLLIITINSLVGFASQISHIPTNWNLLLPLTGLAVIGLFIGAHFAERLPTVALRRGFAYGVLLLAGIITVREIGF